MVSACGLCGSLALLVSVAVVTTGGGSPSLPLLVPEGGSPSLPLATKGGSLPDNSSSLAEVMGDSTPDSLLLLLLLPLRGVRAGGPPAQSELLPLAPTTGSISCHGWQLRCSGGVKLGLAQMSVWPGGVQQVVEHNSASLTTATTTAEANYSRSSSSSSSSSSGGSSVQ